MEDDDEQVVQPTHAAEVQQLDQQQTELQAASVECVAVHMCTCACAVIDFISLFFLCKGPNRVQ